MDRGKAFLAWLEDLGRGDPIAWTIAGFFAFLATLVAMVWIVDLRRKQREKLGKKPKVKQNPAIPKTPTGNSQRPKPRP